MLKVQYASGGTMLRGLRQEDALTYAVTETPLDVSPSNTPVIDRDSTLNRIDSGGQYNNAQLVPNMAESGCSYESLTPDIATITSTGAIEFVAVGTMQGIIRCQGQAKYINRKMAYNAAAVYEVWTGFVDGTLGSNCRAVLLALIAGKDPGDLAQLVYDECSSDLGTPHCIRNTNSFAASLDFSAMSFARSGISNDRFPVTLVTNRHAIAAKHVAPAVGSQVAFKSAASEDYQVVTVAGRKNHDLADLAIIYFDAPITVATPCKTMPFDWREMYIPGTQLRQEARLPALQKTMHDYAEINGRSWWSVRGYCQYYNTLDDFSQLYHNKITTADFTLWSNRTGIPGDSGSPAFLVINGELIYIAAMHTTGTAPSISDLTTWFNTEMNVLAGVAQGTYVLLHPDLSAFTAY